MDSCPSSRWATFFFNETLRIFNSSDVSSIVQAINASAHNSPILFLFDEPLWQIRFACLRGFNLACEEVNNRYANTFPLLRKIGRDLRKALPGAGIMHIEAFAELSYQKSANPSENVMMLDEAEYLGFDCYGAFDNCGIVDISDILSELQNSGVAFNNVNNDSLSAFSLFKITELTTSDNTGDAGLFATATSIVVSQEVSAMCLLDHNAFILIGF